MAENAEDRERVLQSLNFQSFRRLLFGLLKLGNLCNAIKSKSFIDADSDYECIMYGDFPLAINFSLIFEPGILFLKDVIGRRVEGKMDYEKRALQKLEDYVKEMDYHAGCLRKVLFETEQRPRKDLTEGEVAVTLTEHLLGKLAPGDSYVDDGKTRGKGQCLCGCNESPKYRSTGIGHEDVWHGFIDILFSSHTRIPESIATVTETLSPSTSPLDSETKDEDSPDEETISEDAKGSEDQAIAQTIVFSLLKRQNYPSCQHHLIPNIVITPTEFRVNMYDAMNDILLSSLSLKLFDPKFESLQIESVIILWMVLHYRIFCAGIKVNELKEEFKKIDIQANFRKIAESKWDIYSKSLKENLSHFPEEKKKNPISYDTYWRAKELTYG
nr:uncharacterized protein LOC117683513 isoform X1 [Crassostrea gigas]